MGKKINALNSSGEALLSGRLHNIKCLLGLLLCIAGINLTVTAAPSDLDPTFGNGSGVIFSDPIGTRNHNGYGMALQSDGKIVMVGSKNPAGTGFIIARYNSDGSLDATFGSGGAVLTTLGGSSESARGVAIQPDGKIVIGGNAVFLNQDNPDLFVARYNSNGSVDTSFGTNGVAIVGFSTNAVNADYFGAIKIGTDGKIVIGGSLPGTSQFQQTTLARLNTNGTLDTSFGSGGKLTNGGYAWTDLTVQPDGSIVTVGYSATIMSSTMIVRKFNINGLQEWNYTRGQDFILAELYGIAAQPDGKFVVAGRFNSKVSVLRLNANGTLDTSFAVDSVVREGRATAVAVQPDGKIVVAADLTDTPFGGYNAIRLNTDGLPDAGFGTNGVVSNLYPNSQINTSTIIIQPDGKILVGGRASITPPQGYYFTILRYKGGSSAPLRTSFDYDGDGKSDVSVFRPSENRWYILKSSDSSVIQSSFGVAGDIPTPADFDGDRKTDVAIFRPSSGDWWYQSSLNGAQIAAHWGQNGDIPRPSDYDGDGRTDFIVYRPADSKWYRLANVGGSSVVAFGTSGDKPVIGDFDGDGKSDPAIYRPSTGVWWYAASGSSGAHRAVQFGISTDVPVPADYDGDGKTDLAVYRPSNGGWHVLNSGNGNYTAFPFGAAEDKPVSADYDGDGKADVGVFRPSNGSWYLLRSTAGFSGIQWGTSSDIPTENSFIQ